LLFLYLLVPFLLINVLKFYKKLIVCFSHLTGHYIRNSCQVSKFSINLAVHWWLSLCGTLRNPISETIGIVVMISFLFIVLIGDVLGFDRCRSHGSVLMIVICISINSFALILMSLL